MAKKRSDSQPIEPREFRTVEQIEIGISKLERRILDIKDLSPRSVILEETGADVVVLSNVRETIREVFGSNSPEFYQQRDFRLQTVSWYSEIPDQERIEGMERGRRQVANILIGLVKRLKEKREDLEGGGASLAPSSYFGRLDLYPRILDVTRELFIDGYHWEAVFAGSKALVNMVKEKSGCCDLDGAPLVRKVFSQNNPVLAFNDLSDQSDQAEQEGMMHLFEGAVLAIRNPAAHSFPEGTEQRAVEYIQLLSLLAYKVQEAEHYKRPS